MVKSPFFGGGVAETEIPPRVRIFTGSGLTATESVPVPNLKGAGARLRKKGRWHLKKTRKPLPARRRQARGAGGLGGSKRAHWHWLAVEPELPVHPSPFVVVV